MGQKEIQSNQLSLPVRAVYSLLAAIRFLTLLPVSWKAEKDVCYLKSSLYFFPLVGAIIGLLVGGIGAQLIRFLPSTIVSVIAVILLAVVSGCLHLDGLADSCDGLFSARSREKMLTIMRDSNIGVMGVTGIISVFFLKFTALSSLGQSLLFGALVLMPLSGRVSMLIMMAILKYVRGDEGLGYHFLDADNNNIRIAAIAGVLWFSFCLMFLPVQIILAAMGCTLITVLLFSWYCYKMIGGFTGDTLGAVCELSEMVVAVSMIFFIPNPHFS